ncbi:membrane protein implicated in regulation of membrane protease activity [Lysinibacillus composti]|nr:putative phage abortive infection protein [Lysinibacillus composti]MBM7610144.1 membrane protein implicated in regulation of membrane protease activity [Lysinibacillus composti]
MLNYLLFALLVFLITVVITTVISTSLRDERKNKQDKSNESRWIYAGTTFAIAGFASPLIILLMIGKKPTVDLFADIGTIGDFFGGTMVGLLSLSSILFVTAAVMMQKDELKLQREELSKTTKEFEVTNNTMKKQAFDSTFFNLISLQNDILKEVTFKNKSGRDAIEQLFIIFQTNISTKSRDEFEIYISNLDDLMKIRILYFELEKLKLDSESYYMEINIFSEALPTLIAKYELLNEHGIWSPDGKFYNKLNNNLTRYLMDKDYINLEYNLYVPIDDIGWRQNYYEKFYSSSVNTIGHYFRNLYRIVKFIVESDLKETEKKTYVGILRAQLSTSELIMLYYNICYSSKGEKFYNLLIENKVNFFQEHLNEVDFVFKNNCPFLDELINI